MKNKKISILAAAAIMLTATGCQHKAPASEDVTSSLSEGETAVAESETTVVTEPPVPEVTTSTIALVSSHAAVSLIT